MLPASCVIGDFLALARESDHLPARAQLNEVVRKNPFLPPSPFGFQRIVNSAAYFSSCASRYATVPTIGASSTLFAISLIPLGTTSCWDRRLRPSPARLKRSIGSLQCSRRTKVGAGSGPTAFQMIEPIVGTISWDLPIAPSIVARVRSLLHGYLDDAVIDELQTNSDNVNGDASPYAIALAR